MQKIRPLGLAAALGLLAAGIAVPTLANAATPVKDVTELGTALSKGGEVSLEADISVAENQVLLIPAGKTLTLDLNGHKLYSVDINQDGALGHLLENRGTLTVKDLAGSGQLTSRGINNRGTLTLSSGTLVAQVDDPAQAGTEQGAAVWNKADSTFRMLGGTLKVSGGTNAATTQVALRVDPTAKATVRGGAFETPYTNIISSGTLELNGVTLSTSTASWTALEVKGGEANIADVTVNASNGAGAILAGGGSDGAGTIDLAGVTVNQTGKVNQYSTALTAADGGRINVHSGNYTSDGHAAYVRDTGGTISFDTWEPKNLHGLNGFYSHPGTFLLFAGGSVTAKEGATLKNDGSATDAQIVFWHPVEDPRPTNRPKVAVGTTVDLSDLASDAWIANWKGFPKGTTATLAKDQSPAVDIDKKTLTVNKDETLNVVSIVVTIPGSGTSTVTVKVPLDPNAKPVPEPSATPTVTPSAKPTVAPTATPTVTPTQNPSVAPSAKPTVTPTVTPTPEPTVTPSANPTVAPTVTPSAKPSATPTMAPTVTPSAKPSVAPSAKPTVTPTPEPTVTPSANPTVTPTVTPTQKSTVAPTQKPSATPTVTPSAKPTVTPTVTPSAKPTVTPTVTPSAKPTVTPTVTPTQKPTVAPSATPTVTPSTKPTVTPTVTPTPEPTVASSATPTPEPTTGSAVAPTSTPTVAPKQNASKGLARTGLNSAAAALPALTLLGVGALTVGIRRRKA